MKVSGTKRKQGPPEIRNIGDLISFATSGVSYADTTIDIDSIYNILPHLIELNELIGMEKDLHTRDTEGEYLHTQIIGPPGTGKSTLAVILGKIFSKLGILEREKFGIIHKEDLVAGYVGQTAIKTKRVLSQHKGGVLFLDEAYSMGGNEGCDSFSKEAVDTLTSFLSENKDSFCFIIAGYEEDINKHFFALNKGLERRFPWKHVIEKYTVSELSKIVFKKISDIQWETSVSAEKMEEIIKQNEDLFKNYAGDVETFVSKAKIAHSKRIISHPKSDKFNLVIEDFENAIKMVKDNGKTTSPADKEKFYGMYT